MGSFAGGLLENDHALDFQAEVELIGVKRAGEKALKSWREFRGREEAGLAPRIATSTERAELVEIYRQGLMLPSNQLQPDFVAREIREFSEHMESADVLYDFGNEETCTLVAALAMLSAKVSADLALKQLLTENFEGRRVLVQKW